MSRTAFHLLLTFKVSAVCTFRKRCLFLIMLTLTSLISNYLFPKQVGNNLRKVQHPYDHPYDALREGWYGEDFPKSAMFLDTLWVANPQEVPPQLKNNTQSGLRVLHPKNWMHMDEKRFEYEMMLKNVMMRDDFKERDKMLISSPDKRAEEQELLDTIIDNLREFHQEHYSFEPTEDDNDLIITLLLSGDVYKKSDYYEDQPLVLVSKLVQEDFMMIQKNAEGLWCFIGGVACFSFTDMGLRGERGFMKVGNHVAFIHAPVPNFKDKIYPTVNHIFDRLEEGKMYWRANWLLAIDEGLCPYEASISGQELKELDELADGFNRKRTDWMNPEILVQTGLVHVSGAKGLDDIMLRVEYQTIRKLPKTNSIFFCLHTFADPLMDLKRAPKAADMMNRSMNTMTMPTLKYRDLDNDETRKEIKDFLEECKKLFV